jgi:inosine/xanthosine triphosphatase
MKINIATGNSVKINMLKEVISDYPILSSAEVVASGGIPSGVSDQPISMEETIQGAVNRAKAAFKKCDYSFGVEAGLAEVPHSKSGFMNITVCAIFDGENISLGLSSGFEYPIEVTKGILSEGINVSTAFHKLGLTEDPDIGKSAGAIGILTKGRLLRKDYAKESVRNALIHLENKEIY